MLAFAGTPDFAAIQLKALLEAGYKVSAVYTQPDRPKGRGQRLQPSPVKEVALAYNLPVFQPSSLKKEDATAPLKSIQPDLLIVSAYGLILPTSVLNIPKYGCWNVHASLLPHHRGAAPIQYALLSGESTTGVTLMLMDKGMDTGDMLLKASTPIQNFDTTGTLHDRLAELGTSLLLDGLKDIEKLNAERQVQDHAKASYAPKIQKSQAHIDFSTSADQIDRQIRAFTPWPTAFFEHNEKAIKVHQAKVEATSHTAEPGTVLSVSAEGLVIACGSGALRIQTIQLPNKKAVALKDFLNAFPAFFSEGMRVDR
ncbi:MAG: methionyl-tRNA formyltransferase [Legionellales bacterium]|nr:methionyl-tRNA formyltransferase [Legionellales bacterium]